MTTHEVKLLERERQHLLSMREMQLMSVAPNNRGLIIILQNDVSAALEDLIEAARDDDGEGYDQQRMIFDNVIDVLADALDKYAVKC